MKLLKDIRNCSIRSNFIIRAKVYIYKNGNVSALIGSIILPQNNILLVRATAFHPVKSKMQRCQLCTDIDLKHYQEDKNKHIHYCTLHDYKKMRMALYMYA